MLWRVESGEHHPTVDTGVAVCVVDKANRLLDSAQRRGPSDGKSSLCLSLSLSVSLSLSCSTPRPSHGIRRVRESRRREPALKIEFIVILPLIAKAWLGGLLVRTNFLLFEPKVGLECLKQPGTLHDGELAPAVVTAVVAAGAPGTRVHLGPVVCLGVVRHGGELSAEFVHCC